MRRHEDACNAYCGCGPEDREHSREEQTQLGVNGQEEKHEEASGNEADPFDPRERRL